LKLKRNIITPCLAFLYLSVAVTGLFMVFHLLGDVVEDAHKILGLLFLSFSIMHIIINWKSLKSYFKQKFFIVAGCSVLLLVVALVVAGKDEHHHHPDRIVTPTHR